MRGSGLTVAVMFGMVFMVGLAATFTVSIGTVVKSQFGAPNAMAQLGTCGCAYAACFLAFRIHGYMPNFKLLS